MLSGRCAVQQFSLNDHQSYKKLLLNLVREKANSLDPEQLALLVEDLRDSEDRESKQAYAQDQLDDLLVNETGLALERAISSGEGVQALLTEGTKQIADAGRALDLGSGAGKTENGPEDGLRYSALSGSASSSEKTSFPISTLIHENNLRQSAALRQSSGQPGAAPLVSSSAARQDAEAALAGIGMARDGAQLD